jgi:hypothetical protein
MIDTTQIILISAITVMTVILTVVGIQLIFVLKELRNFLGKANNIIAELEKIGINAGHGYSEIIGFFSGLKKLFFIVDLLAKKKAKKNVKQ